MTRWILLILLLTPNLYGMVGPERVLTPGFTDIIQTYPEGRVFDIAFDGQTFGVVWAHPHGERKGLWFARIAEDGQVVTPPQRISSADLPNRPVIATSGDWTILAWFE